MQRVLGYRQAVRHRTLTPAFASSNLATPAHKRLEDKDLNRIINYYGALAQSVEHLTFNQVVGGSNPPCFTFEEAEMFLRFL